MGKCRKFKNIILYKCFCHFVKSQFFINIIQERETKRRQIEAEKEEKRREREELELQKKLRRAKEEAEREQKSREKEEIEAKKLLSVRKQATIMQRFLKIKKSNETENRVNDHACSSLTDEHLDTTISLMDSKLSQENDVSVEDLQKSVSLYYWSFKLSLF